MSSVISSDLDELEISIDTSFLESKKVLITGGAGFMGSWLCDLLVRAKAEVLCLDNLSTGFEENIKHLIGRRSFRFLKADVISSLQNVERQDIILHLASRASPEDYQQHPIETLMTNSLGSFQMLEAARRFDSTTLYTSTSEVYGEPEVIPTPEHYCGHVNPVGPRSSYYEGKRFGEALFISYLQQYSLDVRIVRIFNTYGPRIRSDGAYARVIPRFITQALREEDLTVYGDGSQTRSLCYITDSTRAIISLLADDSVKGEVFNIGSPYETRIIDLASKVKELTGSSSGIKFLRLPPGDPRRRCPDISKMRSRIRWEPTTGLEVGLKKTISWFRGRIL